MTAADHAILLREAKPRKLGPLLPALPEPVKPQRRPLAWLLALFWR